MAPPSYQNNLSVQPVLLTTNMSDQRLAEQAAHEIEKLIRIQLANSYRNELRPAQWQALRFFATADPRDRTLTGFARHRRSTIGTTSITVSQLVDRGYRVRGDPQGQRNVDLRVSDKGMAALEHDPMNLKSSVGGRDDRLQAAVFCGYERLAGGFGRSPVR